MPKVKEFQNLGGKNALEMKALKLALQKQGWSMVTPKTTSGRPTPSQDSLKTDPVVAMLQGAAPGIIAAWLDETAARVRAHKARELESLTAAAFHFHQLGALIPEGAREGIGVGELAALRNRCVKAAELVLGSITG